MIEQDHRGIKSRIAPMLGFKIFKRAAVTSAGIELLHRIGKGQFDLGRLGVQDQAAPPSGPRCYRLEIRKLTQKSFVDAVNLHQHQRGKPLLREEILLVSTSARGPHRFHDPEINETA